MAGGFRATISGTTLDFGSSASADVYTVGQGVAPTGSMASERVQPLLAELADDTVLIVGGGPLEAEIYQP